MQAARPPWYVIDVRDSRIYATRGHLPGAQVVLVSESLIVASGTGAYRFDLKTPCCD